MTAELANSPCDNICIMDDVQGICVGCGRTLSEIAGWMTFTQAERTAINATLDRRLALLLDNPKSVA